LVSAVRAVEGLLAETARETLNAGNGLFTIEGVVGA
jgi:hypothetical protein